MTVRDFEPYFDFKTPVTIKTTDGKSYSGIITGVENDFETDSGQDEVELDLGGHYVGIEIRSIISVEKYHKTA